MTGNVHDVCAGGELRQNFSLLSCGKLDVGRFDSWHGVAKIDVFESFGLTDVIVIWNVDAEWATVGSKADDFKCREVWSQEFLFLHFLWPWKHWNDEFRILNQILEFLRFWLINYRNPALKVASLVGWVNIGFNPSNIALDHWSFIFDPVSLRVSVCIHIACSKMLDVFLDHGFLSLVGSIFEYLLHIVVALLDIRCELAEDDVKLMALILNPTFGLARLNTSNCDDISAIRLLECSGVQDIQSLTLSDEVGDVLEVVFLEISAKVTGDTSFFWEVDDAVWTIDREDLLLNLWPELVNDSLVQGMLISVKWIRVKDCQECL